MAFSNSPHSFWAFDLLGGGSYPHNHIGNMNGHLGFRHGLADFGILVGARDTWEKDAVQKPGVELSDLWCITR